MRSREITGGSLSWVAARLRSALHRHHPYAPIVAADHLGGSNDGSSRFIGLGMPDADDPIWTPARISRHAALTEKSDLLGGLYGTAVNLLPSIESPSSLKLVAHCVREVYNRLPDFDGFSIPGSQGERDRAVRALAEVWVTVEDRTDGTGALAAGGPDPDPHLTIRRSSHLAVDEVVVAERTGAHANRTRGRLYVSGRVLGAGEGDSTPSETEARRCIGFFQSHAHIGTKPHRYEQVELERQFRLFERILDLRLKDFLDASDEMAELLAEANASHLAAGGGGNV